MFYSVLVPKPKFLGPGALDSKFYSVTWKVPDWVGPFWCPLFFVHIPFFVLLASVKSQHPNECPNSSILKSGIVHWVTVNTVPR